MVEQITMWQRKHDKKWTVCILSDSSHSSIWSDQVKRTRRVLDNLEEAMRYVKFHLNQYNQEKKNERHT